MIPTTARAVAEVFVLWLDRGRPRTVGARSVTPYRIPMDLDADPLDCVGSAITETAGEPSVLHSTSWRYEPPLILTFIAVLPKRVKGRSVRIECGRRNEVFDHALRHLAWLLREDEEIRSQVSPGWESALAGYLAEPFRGPALRGRPIPAESGTVAALG